MIEDNGYLCKKKMILVINDQVSILYILLNLVYIYLLK